MAKWSTRALLAPAATPASTAASADRARFAKHLPESDEAHASVERETAARRQGQLICRWRIAGRGAGEGVYLRGTKKCCQQFPRRLQSRDRQALRRTQKWRHRAKIA